MLIYHPAFDAYHCAFRMLTITSRNRMLEFAKIRILDFYICFPAEIASVQLPQEHVEIKKVARVSANPYRGPVSGHRAFRELEPIQSAAARMLALTGVFSPTELENGRIVRTGQQLPEELGRSVTHASSGGSAIEEYILAKMAGIPLQGVGGLKQRTGLMEYRYDPA